MDINSICTKSNFHNYVTIKQSDKTSLIELLLRGADGSLLSNLSSECTVTLLDTLTNEVRQSTTEQIQNGILSFRVINDLEAVDHTIEITTINGTKFPSDGDFRLKVTETHDRSILKIIKNISEELALKVVTQQILNKIEMLKVDFSRFIKKGEVTVHDIDKNQGLLDGTYFSDEFKLELSKGILNVTNLLDDSVISSKIANNAITYPKISNDLKVSFDDLNIIGTEFLEPPMLIENLMLETFFNAFSEVKIVSGAVFGKKNSSGTSVVGGGLFPSNVYQIQAKGIYKYRFIVVSFDGTNVYHLNFDGTTLYLKKHTASSSGGNVATYTLPREVLKTDLIKVKLAQDSIEIYCNGEFLYQVPKNSTTLPVFSNRRLGFLQVPADVFTLTDVSYGLPTTKIKVIEREIASLKESNNIAVEKNDLIMFMGQSNMAGRGDASLAPLVNEGGYEFKSISDPSKLYPVVEPFGKNENVTGAISESTKSGSLVSSFVNEYYRLTDHKVIAVSASKGGTSINEWQPNGALLNDAVNRFNIANNWLNSNGKNVNKKIMIWLQGETDGENGMTSEEYKTKFKAMFNTMFSAGIEKCYIIRIGNHKTDNLRLEKIITAQTELAKTEKNVILVSTKLVEYQSLMTDTLHFNQEALNLVGTDAAKNTAFHINNDKEPTMYDKKNDNLYFSYK